MKLVLLTTLALAPLSTLARNASVKTTSGSMKGVPSEHVSSNITVFRGIPFAASTAGHNRWKAPQPVEPWEGTHVMSAFGPVCPQTHTVDTINEDCLSLNIWLPPRSEDDNTECNSTPTPTESWPVYFWIYGGRGSQGAAKLDVYNGAGLANKGVIVVTSNYRKGIFGYLATPELSEESEHNSSGNYGLLDNLKALEWVKKNIANFGGDPDRITIGGQSAGSAAVIQLLFSPLAKGMFSGAIAESGARDPNDPYIAEVATSYTRSLAEAEKGGINVSKYLNASALSELRRVPMETLVNLSDSLNDLSGGTSPTSSLWRPVLDNYVFKYTYSEGIRNGSLNDVPFLSGNNQDESGASPIATITLDDWKKAIKSTYGEAASEVFRLYPASDDVQASAASNNIARDNNKITTWLWANEYTRHRKSPVYQYYWTHGQPTPDAASQGAFHGSEMNYVFNTLYGTPHGSICNWTEEDYSLADAMSTYWSNFIKSGNPNGGGLEPWSASSERKALTMHLGQDLYPMPLVDDDAKLRLVERYFSQNPAW